MYLPTNRRNSTATVTVLTWQLMIVFSHAREKAIIEAFKWAAFAPCAKCSVAAIRLIIRSAALGWCRVAAPRDEPLGKHRVPVLALRIEFIRLLSDRAAFGDLARQPVNDGLVKDMKLHIAHRKEGTVASNTCSCYPSSNRRSAAAIALEALL